MMIIYVSKDKLFPRFGQADVEKQIVWVRTDLPEPVKNFVAEHEKYHLRDKAKWWVWRGVKASTYGACKYPWGFVVCVIMSMSFYRLKYYFNRIRRSK